MTAHRQALPLTPGSEIDKTKYRGWRIARHEDSLLLDGGEAAPRWIASNKRRSMIVRAQNSGALLRWIDEYEYELLAGSIEEPGRLWSKLRTGASLAKLAQRHNVSVGFETEHGNAMILGAKIWHARDTVLGATVSTILLVLLQPYNAVSVAAGPPLARRGPRAMVGPWSRAATPPGAGLRPPGGRVHKRASALLPPLDVCPIRRRDGAAHLRACERADTAL